MLTLVSHVVPSVGDHPVLAIGTDVRTIFTGPSTAVLQMAFRFGEVSPSNPFLVFSSKLLGSPFMQLSTGLRVTCGLIMILSLLCLMKCP